MGLLDTDSRIVSWSCLGESISDSNLDPCGCFSGFNYVSFVRVCDWRTFTSHVCFILVSAVAAFFVNRDHGGFHPSFQFED